MLMNALILSSDVNRGKVYDQGTGAAKPTFSPEFMVLDMDTKEKYTCRINEGFAGLEQVKRIAQENHPPEVLEQALIDLRAEFPPDMSQVTLEVVRFTGKSAAYIRLVCRFAQVAAAV